MNILLPAVMLFFVVAVLFGDTWLDLIKPPKPEPLPTQDAEWDLMMKERESLHLTEITEWNKQLERETGKHLVYDKLITTEELFAQQAAQYAGLQNAAMQAQNPYATMYVPGLSQLFGLGQQTNIYHGLTGMQIPAKWE